MTYTAYESAVKTGSPVFLYLFDNGLTQTRLTSDPRDVTYLAETWTASTIMHSDIEQNGNVDKAGLDLTLPNSDTFAASYLGGVTDITTVTIFRGHRNDVDGEFTTYWKGRLVGAVSGGPTIVLRAESVFTSLKRTGCRARFQKNCRFALYSYGCGVNIADYQTTGTVTAQNGLVLTVTEAALQADGYYKGGVLVYSGHYGFIMSHVGNQLTLMAGVRALTDALVSGPVSTLIAPGCDLSTGSSGCGRFNNILNHGGFPIMATNNPFEFRVF